MKTVSLVCVGIGGYGEVLLNDLLANAESRHIELRAAVEPYPDSCRLTPELQRRGIPLYPSLEDFYAAGGKADIALIATPIAFHTRHILCALAGGSNVVCEKPLCADQNDIDTLIAARDKAGKFVHIGYQWSHAAAIETLKNDIMAGRFGAPQLLKTLVLWPRNADYFKRGTGWAGKLRTASGELVYDSIANNAAAHYLHNMFYLLGERINTALAPTDFEARLLRANRIENFDTADIICRFENGAAARFIASHATDRNLNPLFDYAFEKGRVLYSQDAVPTEIPNANLYQPGVIRAIMADGTEKVYGDPFDGVCRKVYLAAARVRAEADGYERCGIETASVHTRFINRLQETCTIEDFPAEQIVVNGKNTYVTGLYEKMLALYADDGAPLL